MGQMPMSGQTWPGAAVSFFGMWLVMMVAMMLPSLVPMLSRYRRSVRGADGIHLHGLTALVAVGYFVVWAVIGAAVYAAGAGVTAVEMRWGMVAQWLPVAAGVVLLVAGSVQLTLWKARQLALWREGSGCGSPPVPNALGAWRHGLGLGARCSLCCGSLMLALLAFGMMDLVAMAAVTLAISAERLAPAPLRVARMVGVAIIVAGVSRFLHPLSHETGSSSHGTTAGALALDADPGGLHLLPLAPRREPVRRCRRHAGPLQVHRHRGLPT